MLEFVLEGHDGAGKSTVLRGVSETLTSHGFTNEVYAPFHMVREQIPEKDIYPYWNNGMAEEALDLLREVIRSIRRGAQTSRPDVLLYDRHWMTIFSEIDGTNLATEWDDFPPTFFLEAPPSVTKAHKQFSYEVPFTTSDEQIAGYHRKFLGLAEKYSVHLAGRFYVATKTQDLTPIVNRMSKIIMRGYQR